MRNWKKALILGVAAFALGACATMPRPAAQTKAALAGPPKPSSAAGSYLAANLAASQGDIKGAADFYGDLLKDDPDNQDLLVRTFLYAAASGDMARAVPLARRTIAADPDNRTAHLVLAVADLHDKNYTAASGEVSKSGNGAVSQLTGVIVDAWALEGAGKTDDALKELDTLKTRQGVEGLYAFHRALILDVAGRDAQAEAAYKQAMNVLGGEPRATDAYGRFLRRHGRTAQARALYEKVAKQNAGNLIAAAALADMQTNRTPAKLVSSAQEGAAEALFSVAASLNGNNGAERSVLYLNLALYLRPDFDLARALLGDHYERAGQLRMAIDLYSHIAPTSPFHAMIAVQSAMDLNRLGHPNQAIAKVRQLTVQHPGDADVWTALGDLLRNSQNFAEAKPAYDKAIALLPKDDNRLPSLYYARGVCLQHMNMWPDAERDFQQALALNPNRADVLNYLGYSWVVMGKNLDQAVKMLEKARTLRPLDGYIADSVGWAYYRLGRYKQAANVLEEAVQLAPAASEINEHLGDAYWRVGRKLDARFEWNHALSLDPSPEARPRIERKIQLGLDAAGASGT